MTQYSAFSWVIYSDHHLFSPYLSPYLLLCLHREIPDSHNFPFYQRPIEYDGIQIHLLGGPEHSTCVFTYIPIPELTNFEGETLGAFGN